MREVAIGVGSDRGSRYSTISDLAAGRRALDTAGH
jgi:hypothetical protein